jgi:hypothetical protein
MHFHTVDYQKRDGRNGTIVDRGAWLSGIPRPLIICRTLGHKPVVDGVGDAETIVRWVCCDRCGVRPEPQGQLDPAQWKIGDPYTGKWDPAPPPAWVPKSLDDVDPKRERPRYFLPGLWPAETTWTFGGQAILGKTLPGLSAEVKVGNGGSEHTLAAHLRCNPIGALYLHTESLGTWLQRRLNPVGFESRVTGLDVSLGKISWRLWARRDASTHWAKGTPRWQQGSITVDPRDRLLGRRRYWYIDEGDPVTATVRLPHGDDHQVTLQLQRQEYGREKRRRKQTWCVDWTTGRGIPTKPNGRGGVSGFGVEVSDVSVREGAWAMEASAAIAKRVTDMRAREGMADLAQTKAV